MQYISQFDAQLRQFSMRSYLAKKIFGYLLNVGNVLVAKYPSAASPSPGNFCMWIGLGLVSPEQSWKGTNTRIAAINFYIISHYQDDMYFWELFRNV